MLSPADSSDVVEYTALPSGWSTKSKKWNCFSRYHNFRIAKAISLATYVATQSDFTKIAYCFSSFWYNGSEERSTIQHPFASPSVANVTCHFVFNVSSASWKRSRCNISVSRLIILNVAPILRHVLNCSIVHFFTYSLWRAAILASSLCSIEYNVLESLSLNSGSSSFHLICK